jgi:hypothetical protein
MGLSRRFCPHGVSDLYAKASLGENARLVDLAKTDCFRVPMAAGRLHQGAPLSLYLCVIAQIKPGPALPI